jgi:hypothetical protein
MPRITLHRLAVWLRWLTRPPRASRSQTPHRHDIARDVEVTRDGILAQSY